MENKHVMLGVFLVIEGASDSTSHIIIT